MKENRKASTHESSEISYHTDFHQGLEIEDMLVLVAWEYTQAAPQSFRLNKVASRNMLSMLVTLVTSHLEMSLSKDFASRNMECMLVTLDTSHFEMSPLNDVAPKNMALILATRDTSHSEMSPANDSALKNILDISFTLDTSHFEISELNDVEKANIKRMSVTLATSHFERSLLKRCLRRMGVARVKHACHNCCNVDSDSDKQEGICQCAEPVCASTT